MRDFSWSAFRHQVTKLYVLFTLLFLCSFSVSIEAVYINRFTTIENGGITYTGNALGLSKEVNLNQPGTSDSIGAFITTDVTQQVGAYPNSSTPLAGTTLTWQNNSSSAILDLPTGSSILYAELIWSGSYGFQGQIPFPGNPFIPDVTAVTFTTPQLADFQISPDPATSQIAMTPGFPAAGNYVRSQNVTSIIQGAGAGTYVVSGVPGTVGALDNTHNVAGWVLAVVYANPNMLTSDMTIFVGCEQASSAGPPAEASGFCAPPSGIKNARLFASATEGDYAKTGDQLLFGPTSTLTPADAVSGSNNPLNNFFCSQINTVLPLTIDPPTGKLIAVGSSTLDTRGSYGDKNFPVSGVFPNNFGRQGFDITSVDVTSKISYNQTAAFALGTTTGDDYTISSLGIQITIGSPILQSTKKVNSQDSIFAALGDVVDYTFTINNMGTADAFSCLFKDLLQVGETFVPGSFKFNGVTQADPNLTTGFPMGTIGMGDTVTVEFQAQINAYPASQPNYTNKSMVTYAFQPCLGNEISLETTSNEVQINFLPIANPNNGTTLVNTLFLGASVLDNDIGTGLTVSSYTQGTQGGVVVVQPDGTYSYNPPLNFTGIDTFDYTIEDAFGNFSSTTVTITVVPVNTPPVANNDSGTTLINTPLHGASVLDNDVGDGLIVVSNTQGAQGGTVVVNSDGTYLYTPPLNFTGVDTFTYTASDVFGNLVTATVTITVTPSNVIPYGNPDSFNTLVNTPVGGNVLVNDSSTLNQIVSYTQGAQGGTVVFDPNVVGNFTYTPPLNFVGVDTFTYTASDPQGNLVTETVTIHVYPNVLPIANPDVGTTPVNTPLHGSSVLSNDTGNGITVISYTQGTQGGTVVVNVDGTYLYTPPLNFVGVDTFTYTIQDLFGNTASATVTITVTPLDPPRAFVGHLSPCKQLNKTQYSLRVTWKPSLSPSVVAYRLYHSGKLVKIIPANAPLVFETCLPYKKFAFGYELSAVDASNSESALIKIKV